MNDTGETYIKTGKESSSRIIDLTKVNSKLQSTVQSPIKLNDFLKSLPGYHAFTGCDTVSAFAGKGKAKGLKLLTSNDADVKAFLEQYYQRT